MHTSLNQFIAHARSKGMDLQTVRLLLLSAGWKEKDISTALASEALDMPVPVPSDAGGARDAFFHLLTFTTLYSTVIATVVLLFTYINRLLPDPATLRYYDASTYDFSGIRWSLAVLIVSFPLFILLSRAVHRECAKHPEKLASGIRKWLTYLTLFVTACTLIGDVITLFFYLLDGELTLRFFLKVIALFVMSGLPFWYYFTVVRLDPAKYVESKAHTTYFGAMCIIIPLVFVWGLFIVGSPSFGRLQRFDEQRISDLRQIHEEIINQTYGQQKYSQTVFTSLPKPLPESLQSVSSNVVYNKVNIVDPKTKQPYEYTVKDHMFDLCATFDLSRDQSYDVVWNHPAGHHCFSFDGLDTSSK